MITRITYSSFPGRLLWPPSPLNHVTRLRATGEPWAWRGTIVDATRHRLLFVAIWELQQPAGLSNASCDVKYSLWGPFTMKRSPFNLFPTTVTRIQQTVEVQYQRLFNMASRMDLRLFKMANKTATVDRHASSPRHKRSSSCCPRPWQLQCRRYSKAP